MRGHVQTRVVALPWSYEVAAGSVSGFQSWSKMGYNMALSGVMEDIWSVGGIYVWPTAEMQVSIKSSSINDSTTGSGLRSVRLFYLNGSGTQFEEVLSLNGTTAVDSTGTNIYRFNNLRTVTAGATGQATGSVWITQKGSAVIYSQISAGEARARQVLYTVPAGKKLWIYRVALSCGAAVAGRAVHFLNRANYDNMTGSITTHFTTYTDAFLQDMAYTIDLEFPTIFPTLTDIKVSAVSPDGVTYGNCVLRGFLEDV